MKATCRFAATALAAALVSFGLAAHAATFINDVMVIGNGIFGMQAALDLSGDEWRSSIMPVVTDGQGNVVIDMPIPSPDMMPPSLFMRPFIRASDPSKEIDIGEIEIAIP